MSSSAQNFTNKQNNVSNFQVNSNSNMQNKKSAFQNIQYNESENQENQENNNYQQKEEEEKYLKNISGLQFSDIWSHYNTFQVQKKHTTLVDIQKQCKHEIKNEDLKNQLSSTLQFILDKISQNIKDTTISEQIKRSVTDKFKDINSNLLNFYKNFVKFQDESLLDIYKNSIFKDLDLSKSSYKQVAARITQYIVDYLPLFKIINDQQYEQNNQKSKIILQKYEKAKLQIADLQKQLLDQQEQLENEKIEISENDKQNQLQTEYIENEKKILEVEKTDLNLQQHKSQFELLKKIQQKDLIITEYQLQTQLFYQKLKNKFFEILGREDEQIAQKQIDTLYADLTQIFENFKKNHFKDQSKEDEENQLQILQKSQEELQQTLDKQIKNNQSNLKMLKELITKNNQTLQQKKFYPQSLINDLYLTLDTLNITLSQQQEQDTDKNKDQEQNINLSEQSFKMKHTQKMQFYIDHISNQNEIFNKNYKNLIQKFEKNQKQFEKLEKEKDKLQVLNQMKKNALPKNSLLVPDNNTKRQSNIIPIGRKSQFQKTVTAIKHINKFQKKYKEKEISQNQEDKQEQRSSVESNDCNIVINEETLKEASSDISSQEVI